MKSNIKIFCIGLNKTGTTSIHIALQILGFNSVHHRDSSGKSIKAIIKNNYDNNLDILKGIKVLNKLEAKFVSSFLFFSVCI